LRIKIKTKMKIIYFIICLVGFSISVNAQAKNIIKTADAPIPIAPYSQAVKANGFIFLSGQIGINPQTKGLVSGGVEAETHQIMQNIIAVLKAAGANLNDVVNTNIYIKDVSAFSKVNAIYGTYFKNDFPARTTVGVADLPGGAEIEISVIAIENTSKKTD
jgi:2-iminobutanoate/2-iminopropanoate deaminase